MEDNIRQAEADISHFLLYPEQVNKKSLEEGVCFNLLNQVRELEEQLLHERYQKKAKGNLYKQFYRKYGTSR